MSDNHILDTVLINSQIEIHMIEQVKRNLQELGLLFSMEDIYPLKKGMTNKLFVFTSHNHKYLLRLSGLGTSKIINRKNEAEVYERLRNLGVTEEVLYINPINGIKISKFISDSHTCDCRNQNEVKDCICFLKEFHEKNLQVSHAFDIFAEIRLYEEQCGIYPGSYDDFTRTREDIISLRNLICIKKNKPCLCHIDPVYDNFLMKEKEIYLIDWEYSGMCDPFIDIAMFCIYAEYDKETTDWVILQYLGKQDSEENRMLIYAYMSAGAYLWVLWCEIKRSKGVDYAEYEDGQYRLSKEYFRYANVIWNKKRIG